MNLQALQIRLVRPNEEQRYQALMQAHHYLGSLVKIGETLWYVATILGEWVALLSFSSAALNEACGIVGLAGIFDTSTLVLIYWPTTAVF